MSMITNPFLPGTGRGTARRVVEGALSATFLVLAVLTIWTAILIAIPFLGPSGRQVVLVGNHARSVHAILASGGSILAIRNGTIIARSSTPGFAAALYRHGAPLVLEARIAAGCLGRRS